MRSIQAFGLQYVFQFNRWRPNGLNEREGAASAVRVNARAVRVDARTVRVVRAVRTRVDARATRAGAVLRLYLRITLVADAQARDGRCALCLIDVWVPAGLTSRSEACVIIIGAIDFFSVHRGAEGRLFAGE